MTIHKVGSKQGKTIRSGLSAGKPIIVPSGDIIQTSQTAKIKTALGRNVQASSGSNLWTPKCAFTSLWLDASIASSVTLDGSGNVSQWNDLSGNNRHTTQSSSGSRPSYVSGQYLSFDGVNDALLCPSGFLNNWTQFSLFFVISAPAQQNNAFFAPQNNAQVGLELVWTSVASLPTLARTNNVNKFTSGLYSNDSNFAITALMADNFSTFGKRNGDTVSAVNSAGISALNFNGIYALGQYASNFGLTFFGQFLIKEFIVTNYFTPTSDTEKIEGYLAHKWGHTSLLPSGHPYKTNAPTIN